MITPSFSLRQDDDFVYVTIRCPYVRTQEVEFFLEDTEFKFYAKPYFLRLNLPCPIVEDGRENASYDVSKGEIVATLPKVTKGQHFPDLDLLTKLLAPKNPAPEAFNLVSNTMDTAGLPSVSLLGDRQRPLIEVISDPATQPNHKPDSMEEDEAGEDAPDAPEDFDWDLPQTVQEEAELMTEARYGFNNSHSENAAQLMELCHEVLDLADINTSTPASRRSERLMREELKFDDEYYMGDFLYDEEIQRVLKYIPETWRTLNRIQKRKAVASVERPGPDSSEAMPPSGAETETDPSTETQSVDGWLEFSAQEREQMLRLPNKEYLLDDEKAIYLGLVDIMFAYCYNHRTTEGDNTVGSGWTICKLSATLACFEVFATLRETLVADIRRSLTYPLYRHFGLSLKIVEDLAVLFKLGRRAILKALLEIKDLLERDEICYMFNRLYIDDYCIWIQKASDKKIKSLASELNHIAITKEEIGWQLDQLEAYARESVMEEAE
ncbi:SHQ1 protein-domain-containing protein [Polychytrium aggregatum]|uniref:SHQ1 protein-domain-containing protein n=1 Tax=Polychytrium aggregatum TaxID=110093 RepID=UPI0022FE4877|nr:SHQ1 protein-domain-containing protein [Polychytrium aggregatum]KAI9208549.1 SHQ1 protein-domain-containing protein [Polychytrium aggregatum]